MTDAFRETAAGTARSPSTQPWAWQTLAPRLVGAEKRLRDRRHRAVVTRAPSGTGHPQTEPRQQQLGRRWPQETPPRPTSSIPWPSPLLRTAGWEQRSELEEVQNCRHGGVWKPLPLFTDGEAEAEESAGGSRPEADCHPGPFPLRILNAQQHLKLY